MDLTITSLKQRPHLESSMWELSDLWPEFMKWDPIANFFYNRADTVFSDFGLVATTPDDPERVVARAFVIPFSLRGDELPDTGWDAVVRWGVEDHLDGREPTHMSALEIVLRPEARGRGVAGQMIHAMRDVTAGMGLDTLVAPVRPNGKHLEPDRPMDDYAFATRDDGLPIDPWLRTHVRAGGEILKIAPRSMVITGTLDQWREWTGDPIAHGGDVLVDGALVPVIAVPQRNIAVYVEPNVWVQHRVG